MVNVRFYDIMSKRLRIVGLIDTMFIPCHYQNMKYDERALYALLGKRIKTLRKQAELTQQGLADALDLPRTSLTTIEAGKQGISVYLLFELARVLNVGINDIVPNHEGFERQFEEDLPPATANFVREFMDDNL